MPDRLLEQARMAGIVLAAGLVLAVIARRSVSSMLILAGVLTLWQHAGTGTLAATVFFAGASVGLGSLFVAGQGVRRWSLALLLGMLLLAGSAGWLLPYPIHERLFYEVALGAIWVVRFNAIRTAAARMAYGWQAAVRRAPGASLLFALVFFLGAVSLWLPTIQYDDLAGHLAIPVQLRELKYYRLDAASQVWAMTPWASDVVQGVVGVLAGADARGGVNAIWYALASYFIWDIARSLRLPPALRWMVAAAFASQPLFHPLLGGMQTEAALTALTAAAVSLGLYAKQRGKAASLLPLIWVCSGLIAVKATQIVLVGPVAVWALLGRNLKKDLALVLRQLPAILLISGSSYFYAALITGNPVLPVFNDIFRSPYFDVQRFGDAHWSAGVSWLLPWSLTFSTENYMEAYDGAAGFLMLGLLGGTLLALAKERTRGAMVVILIALVCSFYNVRYLRYIFPFLSVAIPLSVAALYDSVRRGTWLVGVIFPLIVLNVCFAQNSFYRLKEPLIWGMFTLRKQASMIETTLAPESAIADHVRRFGGSAGVLLTEAGRPFLAPFAGKAVVSVWYDPTMQRAAGEAEQDPSGQRWRKLIDLLGLRYVVAGPSTSPALQAGLQAMDARRVLRVGESTLWEILSVGQPALANARDYARLYLWPNWLRLRMSND
ncbi:hypothetical protein BKK81_15995 [Cupriavidus sp. USMAHM13]|nr:hypothetical protein BKK81_15995 [Cupriavidus sp. USMAHM13]